jgi:hypothetical protein
MVMSKRASIGGSTFGVGLHTDQQSLILGEMMTARNKLQEENQTLRDRLQDAEMMIRLLQIKLTEHNIRFDITKETGIPINKKPVLTNKANRKTTERPKSMAVKKNAFRNQVAPGKKTFEPKVNTITISGPLSKFNVSSLPQSPKSRSKMLHAMSCSPDSRQAEPEEPRTTGINSNVPKIRAKSTVTSKVGKSSTNIDKSSNTGYVHCFGEEQFPGDAQQMRSVIGKLAQVVINEYSTNDDDDENIIFE